MDNKVSEAHYNHKSLVEMLQTMILVRACFCAVLPSPESNPAAIYVRSQCQRYMYGTECSAQMIVFANA